MGLEWQPKSRAAPYFDQISLHKKWESGVWIANSSISLEEHLHPEDFLTTLWKDSELNMSKEYFCTGHQGQAKHLSPGSWPKL